MFFFTAFLDDFRSKDMYEVFKKFFGDIDEVIILTKLDKNRRNFGFVRFFHVKDEQFLATGN